MSYLYSHICNFILYLSFFFILPYSNLEVNNVIFSLLYVTICIFVIKFLLLSTYILSKSTEFPHSPFPHSVQWSLPLTWQFIQYKRNKEEGNSVVVQLVAVLPLIHKVLGSNPGSRPFWMEFACSPVFVWVYSGFLLLSKCALADCSL